MNSNDIGNELPFCNLHDDQFQNIIKQSNLKLNDHDIAKLKQLTFNPFSIDDRGKPYLTMDTNLDPDNNYYNHIIHHIDNCDYYDEDKFKKLLRTTNETNFSILHCNIRSITNKHADFVEYLDSLDHKFSVIGLTETWLNSNNVNDFPLYQYSFVGRVRNHKIGGGVGLYVKQSYQYRERHDLSINIDDVIESQFIELARPDNILVGVIYRPPNNNLDQFKESLLQLLQKLDSQKKKCFLMGDINSDLLKVEENRHSNDIINYMFSSSFYPLISRPTRITSTSATLIDNIFVNSFEDNFTTGLLLTDISDHLPIFQIATTITNTNTTPIKETKYRKITSETLKLLNQKLKCENWKEVYREANPQYAYTTFYKILYNAFDETVPLMRRKISFKKSYQTPWITKEILASRKLKNKLYKRFINNPNNTNEKNYKTYRNKFNKIKRLAKKSYYNGKFQESQGNIRQTWKLINEITNKNKSSSELPDNFMKDGNIITDPNEIANNFNEYFVNVGPKLAEKNTTKQREF